MLEHHSVCQTGIDRKDLNCKTFRLGTNFTEFHMENLLTLRNSVRIRNVIFSDDLQRAEVDVTLILTYADYATKKTNY